MGPRRFIRRFIFIQAILFAPGMFAVALFPLEVYAQYARVQFIHASPYAEAATLDVYRNGVLWLTDFGFNEATPFLDWPSGRRFRVDVAFSDEGSAGHPFFTKTLALLPGRKYIIIAAGDPVYRPDNPPFNLFLVNDAEEAPDLKVGLGSYTAFFGGVDYASAPHIRGGYENSEEGSDRVDRYQVSPHGWMMPGYGPIPPFQFEIDTRDATGRILLSVITDARGTGNRSFIHIETGFISPRQLGDQQSTSFIVFPDGSVRDDPSNVARVQFIHNSPYLEADSIDIHVTRLDSIGVNMEVYHEDDLTFREATPYLDLPSGLVKAGQNPTAPELVLSVTSEDEVDTLYSRTIRLQYKETYIIVLEGDPLSREGHPGINLAVYEGWREMAADSGSVDLLFSHGVPDIVAANIGEADQALPMVGFLRYGDFARYTMGSAADDTLYISNAESQAILARVEPELRTRGLSDSSLVVLTSGFLNPPRGFGGEDRKLALVAALPSGGPLLRFVMKAPPPWWQDPWFYIVGLFVLGIVALAGNQVRVIRLRARERELRNLVEDRTHELVEANRKTEEQARKLVELDEAKNRFFANISHEFRTPLTMIMGPVQDAIDGYYGPVDSRLQREFHVIRRYSRRLLRLINQLLDLSRLEAGRMDLRMDQMDLGAFVHDLVSGFVPLAERNRIKLHFIGNEESLETASEVGITESGLMRRVPNIMADPDSLEKVFSNLIANAIKFTPENGRVDVAVRIPDPESAEFVEVVISDTGRGIRATDLSRIFDRFQQADTSIRRSHEGSGIGLTLARELVELHHGQISVSSIPGEGSTFTVVLPLLSVGTESARPDDEELPIEDAAEVILGSADVAAKGPETEAEEAQAPADFELEDPADAEACTPLVLVVEDNADVRSWIRDHIGKEYRLLEAEDGEQGLELARAHVPDLIISDVMMPRMDGYEMCRLIKANDDLQHIPIVMLTAKAGERDTLEGLRSGADDYLSKPFSMPELQARIANLITTREQLRELFSRDIFLQPSGIPIKPADEVFLNRVLDSINSHLGNTEYNVDWMADEVGLSRRQLERRLEAVTGEAPAILVRRLRLERASQLLRARAGTVSEVAYAVGFRSPTHFSRIFREAFGEPPSQHSGKAEKVED